VLCLLYAGLPKTHLSSYSICYEFGSQAHGLSPMFPLSCARVHAHTGRETSAHKKTWSAQKISFQKWLCIYFLHIVTYTVKSW